MHYDQVHYLPAALTGENPREIDGLGSPRRLRRVTGSKPSRNRAQALFFEPFGAWLAGFWLNQAFGEGRLSRHLRLRAGSAKLSRAMTAAEGPFNAYRYEDPARTRADERRPLQRFDRVAFALGAAAEMAAQLAQPAAQHVVAVLGEHRLGLVQLRAVANAGSYKQLVFDEDATQLAFVSDRDVRDSTSKRRFSLYHASLGGEEAERVVNADAFGEEERLGAHVDRQVGLAGDGVTGKKPARHNPGGKARFASPPRRPR